MSKVLFNDELRITTVEPKALCKLFKAVEEAKQEGFILDPEERNGYRPRALSPYEYTVTLVKAQDVMAEELKGKGADALIEIIREDESKERLLEIAKILSIEIPSDKKVPKAISGYLCKAVKEELGGEVEV